MGASSRNNENVEPIIYLMCVMIVFFVGVLLASETFWKEDAQMFQVIATCLSGFTGALLARIKPAQQNQSGGDDVGIKITNQPPQDPSPQVKVV